MGGCGWRSRGGDDGHDDAAMGSNKENKRHTHTCTRTGDAGGKRKGEVRHRVRSLRIEWCNGIRSDARQSVKGQ